MNSLKPLLALFGLFIICIVFNSLNADSDGQSFSGSPGSKCELDANCTFIIKDTKTGKCIGFDKDKKIAGYCEERAYHGSPCKTNENCYHICYNGYMIPRCRGARLNETVISREQCYSGNWFKYNSSSTPPETDTAKGHCLKGDYEGLPNGSSCNFTADCGYLLKCGYGINPKNEKKTCMEFGVNGVPAQDGDDCEDDDDCFSERCKPSTLKCCSHPEYCHLIYVAKGENYGIMEGLPCTNNTQCIKKELLGLNNGDLYCHKNTCMEELDFKEPEMKEYEDDT